MENSSKVIVALDFGTYTLAMACAEKIDPKKCRAVKVGKELFTAVGPAIVRNLMQLGFAVFLDLKYHDIPNTVAGAVRAACGLGVWMMNVHALGGRKMMEAAAAEVAKIPEKNRPLVVVVTVLTSMESPDLEELGLNGIPETFVSRWAKLAQESGLDGVVCSGKETQLLRRERGEKFVLVTPGIRLPGGDANDQARIVTPEIAIANGSNYIVIGRPVTQAKSPNDVLLDINQRVLSVQQQ
ncbi:MAG: orotidine-5'-phosphate decarboxylase [bacterium]|nr:orotidine-5'-phosphate decarboxylase [bacterium]